MLLIATTSAATMKSLISPSDLMIIDAQVPTSPFSVFIQNTQLSATLYVALNGSTATPTTGTPLVTNDSITFTCQNLGLISLVSSAATNTVIFEVNQ